MGLIKLDYAVLSILANDSLSGYDITARLREIWKTTHSRIYPVLAKLEKLGLVEYKHMEQDNKPDKKIYTITGGGIEALKEWLITKTSQPVRKDEGLLKVMCLHLLDTECQEKLIKERIKEVKKEIAKLEKIFRAIKEDAAGKVTNTRTKYFNAHIISEATNAILGIEMAFGEWVLELLKKENVTNYYDYKFVDFLRQKFMK